MSCYARHIYDGNLGHEMPSWSAQAISSASDCSNLSESNFSPVDPIKALFWTAVINGVIAVPIMAVMMLMAARADIMGPFVVKRRLKVLGWLATAAMAAVVVAMFATWGK